MDKFTFKDFTADEIVLSIAERSATDDLDLTPTYALYRRGGRLGLFKSSVYSYDGLNYCLESDELSPIGEVFGYRSAFYYAIEGNEEGYLALGSDSEWVIFNMSYFRPAEVMARGRIFYDACGELSKLIGLSLASNWVNLLTGKLMWAYPELKSTPDHIEHLSPGQIFVFGSNIQGMHGGGAARAAYEKFGAIWGQGVGLQGNSYAIPTMNLSIDQIGEYVKEFLAFASDHPEYEFLVTRIGCGIAGMSEEQIAPLFTGENAALPNVVLPQSFIDIIST